MLLRSILRPRALRPAVFRSIRLHSSVPLIQIENATFYKHHPDTKDVSNPPMFPQLNFALSTAQGFRSQHWAIVGNTNRTDLLDILRGQHISDPSDARSYPYLLTDKISTTDPRLRTVSNAIQYVGFNGQDSGSASGTRGAYLSARYESYREETDWTLQQFLRGQTYLNPAEGEEKGVVHDEELFGQVIADLHLEHLLDMPMQNLSNGQMRRARIAKALSRKPELLLLDEPFSKLSFPYHEHHGSNSLTVGLDPATVKSISKLLHRLAKKCSPRLVLALRPQDQVPDWITHTMILGNDYSVLLQGLTEDVRQALADWSPVLKVKQRPVRQLPDSVSKAWDHVEAGALDKELLRDLLNMREKVTGPVRSRSLEGEVLIDMAGVRVQYGDKTVLGGWTSILNGEQKEGLHWRVRRGQHWAILGANGSGKTTLLSMITSDHPQTYAQPVKLFGRSRLPEAGTPGISIFELQSRMGHSSPEIHALFPRNLTIRQALESAFAETFLAKPKLNTQLDNQVDVFLKFWRHELDPNYDPKEKPIVSTQHFPVPNRTHYMEGLLPMDFFVQYADQITFGQLNISQQRIVLFLRALISKPDIVILDEALSGLSASQRNMCMAFLSDGECAELALHKRLRRKGENTSASFKGITNDQALIVISHVPEEIPDSVRFFMRLPSDPGAGAEPLDFRLVTMASFGASLASPKEWEQAWLPPSEFVKIAEPPKLRRSRPDVANSPNAEIQDPLEFGWWTI
ncbi:unnamed protein product [Penicillium salamii]|nr:unnamed protein product [Penicillium salamii]